MIHRRQRQIGAAHGQAALAQGVVEGQVEGDLAIRGELTIAEAYTEGLAWAIEVCGALETAS